MRAVQKANVTDQDLTKVLDLAIKINSLNKAIKTLKKTGEIKDYCTDVYYRRINKVPRYIKHVTRKKGFKKNTQKLAFMLNKKGHEYSEIASILKIPRIQAFYLVNPGKPKEYKETVKETKHVRTKRSALKLVDDWNKYNIENRFPTDETIKAFEFLNLTPPKRL